jgi:hypothetical protein
LRQIPVAVERIDARGGWVPLRSETTSEGTFVAGGVPPGRYFIRAPAPSERWVLKSVTHEGRDITETAIELKEDLIGVVMTFTDRPTEINGRVRTADGRPDDTATVLIFPTDPETWVDFGQSPGKLRWVRVDAGSRFTLRILPGDYFVVAVPEELSSLHDAKALETLSRRATRLRLFSGDTKVVELTTVR